LLPVKYYFASDTINTVEYYWKYASYPIFFLSKEFYPPSGRVNLVKTIEYNYDKLGNVVATTTNSVFDPNYYYLKSTWRLNSVKDTIKTNFSYSPDLMSVGQDSAIYKGMVLRNLVNQPVEQAQFVNNRQISWVKTNYYSPYTGVYLPRTIQARKANEPIETRVSYGKYDIAGRVLNVYKDDGPLMSYKWGYNNQYVIAECKNADSDEFYYNGFEEGGTIGNARTGARLYSGSFTTSDKLAPGLHGKTYKISYWYYTAGSWKFSGELNYTGQVLSGTLDDIRIYPDGAQMTTYTYDPLFGVTSISDVRDMPTYYEYDIAGRLRAIKDKDGKILKLYDYQYLQPITQ
jgi:YD repeat-containing protein